MDVSYTNTVISCTDTKKAGRNPTKTKSPTLHRACGGGVCGVVSLYRLQSIRLHNQFQYCQLD